MRDLVFIHIHVKRLVYEFLTIFVDPRKTYKKIFYTKLCPKKLISPKKAHIGILTRLFPI